MIKAGIIGCGFMGKMHANCYKAIPDVKVEGVYDIRPEEAQKAAEITGAKVYGNPDDLINSDVDTINICVPTYLHKDYVIKTARAGKNIFCEKPFTLNMKDTEEAIKEIKKAKIKVMFGMVVRFWPDYMEFKKIVDSKKYGKLTTLVCTRVSGHPLYCWNGWFSDPKLSGSAVLDLHIHDTDFIFYLLGKPKSVRTMGTKTKRGWEHVFTTYEYRGISVIAEGGWDHLGTFPFEMAIRGTFEDGTTICYSSKNQPLIVYGRDKAEPVEMPKPQVGSVDGGGNISDLGGYYNEIKYWVECLSSGSKQDKVTVESVKTSLGIVMSEMKSLETGKAVKIS